MPVNELKLTPEDIAERLKWTGFPLDMNGTFDIFSQHLISDTTTFFGLVFTLSGLSLDQIEEAAALFSCISDVDAPEVKNVIEMRFDGLRPVGEGNEARGGYTIKFTWIEGEFAVKLATGQRIARLSQLSPRLALAVSLQAIVEGDL